MITFENVSKQYGGKVLLDRVSTAIPENGRTGLIGVNGSGKTTLLTMLYGEEQCDSGFILKPSNLTMGYLPQEVEILDNLTPLEILLEPYAHVLDYEKQLQSVSEKIDEAGLVQSLKKIDTLLDTMETEDVYSLTSRAKAILAGLGVPEHNWTEPVQYLSGGFRMRSVLGKLLLLAPDFLLLDEPTNHLDMDSLVWLEKYLERQKCGMLIVSHDRDFLNRITTSTAEIGNKSLTFYKGNYDQYRRMKQEADESALNRARNIGLKIAQTERFVERFKAKATKASQAQARVKQLEKLRSEMPEIAKGPKQIHFSFPEPKQSGSVPLKLINMSVGYGDVAVLKDVSLNVNRGEKVAIVGPNGAGKSTLLKAVASMISPCRGKIEQGHNVVIRYFGQHRLEQLAPLKTLYETVICDSVSTEKTFIRNILGAFLFCGDDVEKRVEVLSGGEKARLVLATILASPGNVLLLDEPTNHLDIQSVEMMADAMAAFKGTILFVSHDEFFISKIATRIIELRPGLVRDFPGTLSDYRTYVEMFLAGDTEKGTSVEQKTGIDDKDLRIRERENRKRLARAVEKLERDIASHEEKLEELRSVLENPENALNHQLLHETALMEKSVSASIDEMIKEWEAKQIELGV